MKKFGLNTGLPAEIQLLDASWGVAMSFSVLIDDDKYPTKGMLFYPKTTTIWSSQKPTIIDDPNHDALKSARARWRWDIANVIASFNGSNDPQAIQDKIMAERPKTPADFVKLAIDQLRGNWRQNKVDVFLQWGKPSKKDGKRYLEIAGGSQDGNFITPSSGKTWFEDRSNGLVYTVPSEAIQHPICRGAGFMRSQKAINVTLEEASASYRQSAQPSVALPSVPPPTAPAQDDDDLPF